MQLPVELIKYKAFLEYIVQTSIPSERDAFVVAGDDITNIVFSQHSQRNRLPNDLEFGEVAIRALEIVIVAIGTYPAIRQIYADFRGPLKSILPISDQQKQAMIDIWRRCLVEAGITHERATQIAQRNIDEMIAMLDDNKTKE